MTLNLSKYIKHLSISLRVFCLKVERMDQIP